jgi:hypothetical protein
MKRRTLLLVCFLAVAVGLLAGCGGHKARLAARTTEPAALVVERGMTKKQVRALAGEPQVAGPRCWLYRFVLNTRGNQLTGSSIDGMRFCFARARVSLVQTAVHG